MLHQTLLALLISGAQASGPTLAVVDPNVVGGLRPPVGSMRWRPSALVMQWCNVEGAGHRVPVAVAVFEGLLSEPSVATGSAEYPVGWVIQDVRGVAGLHTWVANVGPVDGPTTVRVGWSTEPWQTIAAFNRRGKLTSSRSPASDGLRLTLADKNPPAGFTTKVNWAFEVGFQLPQRLRTKAIQVTAINHQGEVMPLASTANPNVRSRTLYFRGQLDKLREIRVQARTYHWMKPAEFRS